MTRIIFEMVDGGQSLPYHLLFYMIVHFARVPNNVDINYYFPKGCEFAEKILAILPPHWIRHYEKQDGYTYTKDHIGVPAWDDYIIPDAYNYMRFLFAPYISAQIIPGKYLYISRNKGDVKRQLENEDDVLKIIEPFGFQKIYMEDLSGEDHIRVFSEADFIISPHGSGLSFTTFCSPGVSIIEILGDCPSKLRHFSHIAWHFGFDFKRFTDVETNNEKMRVNCKELYQTLFHHKKLRSNN